MNKPNLFNPDSSPRYVRIYDNGGPEAGGSIDRYTIVFTRLKRFYPYAGSSSSPFHPMGFYQHGEGDNGPIDRPQYAHLGKPITFLELPGDVQAAVRSDYKSYHNIKD